MEIIKLLNNKLKSGAIPIQGIVPFLVSTPLIILV